MWIITGKTKIKTIQFSPPIDELCSKNANNAEFFNIFTFYEQRFIKVLQRKICAIAEVSAFKIRKSHLIFVVFHRFCFG